jgi:hypothetical protein
MKVTLASRRLAAGLLLLFTALSVDGVASAKKPAKKPKGQTVYEDVLDAQKPAVVDCVMEHGLKKGAASVELQIAMRLTGVGQILSCEVGVNQQGGDKVAMADCVKKAVSAGQYPRTASPLVELSRTWTFSFK